MSTYRKEWDCCGSVTETDGWEPDACPFCSPKAEAEPVATVRVPCEYTDEQLAAGVEQYKGIVAPHISAESICGAVYDAMVGAASEAFSIAAADVDAKLRFAVELLAAPVAQQTEPLSKARIREIFLAHGFTIKEGNDDLKPYVYEAARAIERELSASAEAATTEQDVWIAFNSADDDEAVMFFMEMPGSDLKERFHLKHYKCREVIDRAAMTSTEKEKP